MAQAASTPDSPTSATARSISPEDVTTRLATHEEGSFLRLPTPAPVLYLVRTAFDAEGRPVEICEHIMSGERWQLSYEWPAD